MDGFFVLFYNVIMEQKNWEKQIKSVEIDPFLDYFFDSLVKTDRYDLAELKKLRSPEYQQGEKEKLISLFLFDDYEIGQGFDKLPLHMTVTKPLYFNQLGKVEYLKEVNDYLAEVSDVNFVDLNLFKKDAIEDIFDYGQKVICNKVNVARNSLYLTHAITTGMGLKYCYDDMDFMKYVGTDWSPHISYNDQQQKDEIMAKIASCGKIEYLYVIKYNDQNRKEIIDKIRIFE